MDFEKLVQLYEELEQTASGNKIREILAEFYKKISADDIAVITYLTLGRIAPEYENVVLGMAEKYVLKSISIAGGADLSRVKKLMHKEGDVGLTAEIILQKKPQTLVPLGKLTITEFFEKLHKIATEQGSGSVDMKTKILAQLLQKSSPKGAKYISRIALGTLRLGLAEMAVLDALAIAFTGEKNKTELEAAYNICPDVGEIAEIIAKKGIKAINKIDIKVGRPIRMMLAQRVKSLEEMQKKIPGEVTVEAKYDGERVQAHKDSKGKISLFSRRLDNITEQFPDLIEYLTTAIKAKEFIIEGEVIAVNEKGHPLPFQTLMQRRRKYDVEKYAEKIPINYKVFDLLYLDGIVYMHKAYTERTEKLAKLIHPNKEVMPTERIVTDDLKKFTSFFKKMLKDGYEGVIAKSHAEDSVYQAGVRGWNWIKWKKDYVKEMVDTFDVVIVGAFYGKGRRSGTYGALLCAIYNETDDQFETFCKLGTGLTDETLSELPEKMKKYQTERKPVRLIVKKEMEPNVWFEPKIVVEVEGAEITKSPFHSCGYALRFPRFLQYRENKKAEQATSKKEIEEMF